MRAGAVILCTVFTVSAVWIVASAFGDTVLTRGSATIVVGATVTQAGATWTQEDGQGSESFLSRPTSKKQTKVEFSWKLPATVPAAGAKGSITITATGGDLDGIAPGLSLNGPLVGCTGITNATSPGSGCADGDHASVGVSVQPNETATATQEFLIKGGAPGKVTISFGGPKNVEYEYTASAGAPAAGAGSTSSAPLGTPVTLAAPPANKPANISSPPLPAAAKTVELDTQFSDADIDKLAVALKLLLDDHNRRAELDSLSYYCEFIRPLGKIPPEKAFAKPVRGLANCEDVEDRLEEAEGKTLDANGCPIQIVPVWKADTKPTSADEAAALAYAQKQYKTSCPTIRQIGKSQDYLWHMKLFDQNLKNDLGGKAQASIERPSTATDGANPKMTVTWKSR